MTDSLRYSEIAVIWGVAIPLLASFISTTATSWLSTIPARRLPQGTHWSELARTYWPVRVARNLAIIWIAMQAYFAGGDRDTTFGIVLSCVATCSAFAGCVTGFRLAGFGLNLPPGARPARLGIMPARWLLLPAAPSMIAIIVLTLGHGLGWEAFVTAGAVLLLDIVLIAGGAVTILRWTGLMRPADAPLQQLARELAEAEGAPLRSVLLMDLGSANAFAATWTQDLILTDTAVTALDPEELRSVIAHEIGHLRESVTTRLKRMAGLPAIAAIGLAPTALVDQRPLVALGLFAAFYLINRWVSWNYKKLEIEADRHAHLSQSEEGVYAGALEKIHAASLIPAVLNPRHHYPNLYDRMTNAGVPPDFPRPAAPNRVSSMLLAVMAAVMFFFLRQTFDRVVSELWPHPKEHAARSYEFDP